MIYFIQQGNEGAIKIGTASDPTERLKELQTASPLGLLLLTSIPGDSEYEKKLHKKFEAYRTNGEWFHPAAELLEYIENSKNNKTTDEEIKTWCHASCCRGETELETFSKMMFHQAQMSLDQHGFPSGYFGEDHWRVIEAMTDFAKWYGDSFLQEEGYAKWRNKILKDK